MPEFTIKVEGASPDTVRALMEFILGLTGHLYDKNLIEPQAMVDLLDSRLVVLAKEPDTDGVRSIMMTQIDWLHRIGTGLKSGEKPNSDKEGGSN